MPELQIQLLGHFRLLDNDEQVTAFHPPRLQSLLAVLALHRDTLPSRQYLASLFWPQLSEQAAVAQLDHLYQELIQALPAARQWLWLTPDSWQWQPDVQLHLDVTDFEQALAQAQAAADPTQARVAWEEAIRLYTGDLLPDCRDLWLAVPTLSMARLMNFCAGSGWTACASWLACWKVKATIWRLSPMRGVSGSRAPWQKWKYKGWCICMFCTVSAPVPCRHSGAAWKPRRAGKVGWC